MIEWAHVNRGWFHIQPLHNCPALRRLHPFDSVFVEPLLQRAFLGHLYTQDFIVLIDLTKPPSQQAARATFLHQLRGYQWGKLCYLVP